MIIFSEASFVLKGEFYYTSPSNWYSFSQWWSIYDKFTIVSVNLLDKELPSGWMVIPKNVKILIEKQQRIIDIISRPKVSDELGNILKKTKIIYLRMPGVSVFYGYKIAKKYNKNFFVEFHGDWSESYLKTKNEINNVKDIFSVVKYKVLGFVTYYIYVKIGRESIANISIGNSLVSKYSLDKQPCLITTNHTIKKKDIKYVRRERKENNFNLLFVGEIQQRKGLHFLIKALEQIQNRFRVKLRIVGIGSETNKLKKLIAKLELTDFVEFVGFVPNGEELRKKYEQADIFILPSIAAEGVPRVIQEAQSTGCPVVATDIGSTKWALGKNAGVLIPPKDVNALADAVIYLLENERKREEISLNSVKQATFFSFENQVDKLVSFIKQNNLK